MMRGILCSSLFHSLRYFSIFRLNICLLVIYDVLSFMLCTFFKGLFLNSCTFFKGLFVLFCHFFKGLSVAKIQNFLLKGKENGNYFLFKGKVFPFSPIITLMQGKPAGNHFGAERDGGGKNQDRKALVVLQ